MSERKQKPESKNQKPERPAVVVAAVETQPLEQDNPFARKIGTCGGANPCAWFEPIGPTPTQGACHATHNGLSVCATYWCKDWEPRRNLKRET